MVTIKGTNPKNAAEVQDDASPSIIEFRGLNVAAGFHEYLVNQLGAVTRVTEWVEKHGCKGDILMTGHSLGAAAIDLLQVSTDDFAARGIAYTFGEPLVYTDRASAQKANAMTRKDSHKRFVSVEEEGRVLWRTSSLDAVVLMHYPHHDEMVHRTVGVGLYGGHKEGTVVITPWPTNNVKCADISVHSLMNYRANLNYFTNATATVRLPEGDWWPGFHRKAMPDITGNTGEATQSKFCYGDVWSCNVWQDRGDWSKPWEC